MVDIWFEIIWNIIVYDFNFSGVPDLMMKMKTIMIIIINYIDSDNELSAALRCCVSCLDAESEGKLRGRGGVNELKQTELQKEILLLSCRVDSPATVNDVGPEADPPPPKVALGPSGQATIRRQHMSLLCVHNLDAYM